jgi:NAD(P)-dependent dehydrogenase (short-subunit alcohol dehydrogenase family)
MARKILITGGMGTLGDAQAIRFLGQGDLVHLLDHPGLEARTDGRHGAARYHFQDLADLAGSAALVEAVSDEIGGFDVLVNNAALIINKPFEAFSIGDFEDQMRINSTAAFALSRAVAPAMKRQGSGVMINFCSVTLNGRWDGYVPYVTSKGAMLGLTKSLARELGPFGVRVNAVSPGAVISDAEQRVFGDRLEQYNSWVLENQCLKRRIQPADIASVIDFLCSDGAAMVTGQNIAIDGGF